MAAQVVCHDDAPWLRQPGGWVAHLHTVGGLDISFAPACGPAAPPTTAPPSAADPGPAAAAEAEGAPPAAAQRAVAALAVLSFPALEQLHVEVLELPTLGAPYMPGFLGFREVPAYLELLRRAAGKGVTPQLLLVDGTGVLHPRRCGSASHLGVLSGLPTVGVAKSLLHVDGLPGEREVRAAVAAARGAAAPQVAPAGAAQGPQGVADARPLPGGGCWLPLAGARGEEHGAALCAHGAGGSGPISPRAGPPAAARPIYVSVGHRIGLTSALAVVQRCCKHRVPEPIRVADQLSRAEVRRWQLGVGAPAAAAPAGS